LRSVAGFESWPTVEAEKILTGLPTGVSACLGEDQLLSRAVREWRSAADASDDFQKIAHLWRAVECYSARSIPDDLFGRRERQLIRGAVAAVESWTNDQAARLDTISQMLNNPPLMVRLRLALKSDGISITDGEFDSLAATRPFRNALEHGRVLSPLQHRALDTAVAVMNYILVTCLLMASSDEQHSRGNE
jgi:hypothetical protein